MKTRPNVWKEDEPIEDANLKRYDTIISFDASCWKGVDECGLRAFHQPFPRVSML